MFLRVWTIALVWLSTAGQGALAASIDDATGRHVELPAHIERVLPAGPPASVLLFTLAPDKMIGWAHKPGPEANPYLGAASDLPETGPIRADTDPDKIKALKPDVIIDIGTVSPRYIEAAKKIQDETGIPTILLDGSLAATAATYRALGAALGVPERGEALAAAAEHILGEPAAGGGRTAYLGRGADGLTTAPKGSISSEILGTLGLVNVAEGEAGKGFIKLTPDQLKVWDPKLILLVDPDAAKGFAADPAWAGRVHAASLPPFGWLDEPPSVNRLGGVIWARHALGGAGDPAPEIRDFYRLFYRASLSDAALADISR